MFLKISHLTTIAYWSNLIVNAHYRCHFIDLLAHYEMLIYLHLKHNCRGRCSSHHMLINLTVFCIKLSIMPQCLDVWCASQNGFHRSTQNSVTWSELVGKFSLVFRWRLESPSTSPRLECTPLTSKKGSHDSQPLITVHSYRVKVCTHFFSQCPY